ncbi:hypothetical protein H0H87_007989 [Tephrocybe sp. NHM501043]|nr:hypothetical protein H0H87_007989 [Tephrocybe sp. NHM501043]
MPPRFVNPHFLPESSIAVSRRDIYGENDETGEQEIFSADPQLVKRLNELLEPDLALDAETKRSKRRKIQGHIHSEEEAIEPEIEDNEAQANLRAERAGASALDGSSILSRNVKFMPRFGDPKKLKLATVSSSFLAPPVMMIVECKQPPRSTRPPVPRSLLQHYPYNHGGNVPPSQPLASSSTCPKTTEETDPRTTSACLLEAKSIGGREVSWICNGLPLQRRGIAKWE